MIALVDANNFYVSCERVFSPRLEGKPEAGVYSWIHFEQCLDVIVEVLLVRR